MGAVVARVRAVKERAVGRPLLLDRALIRKVCQAVEKGAFLHVAAESVGVSRRTLFAWLERGRDLEAAAERGDELGERELLFVEFLHGVMVAHARARLRAEASVLEVNPLAWLRFGPGRDQGPEAPGWTRPVAEMPPEVRSAAEVLLAQALEQLGLGAAPPVVDGESRPALQEGTEGTGEHGGGV